MDLVAIKSFRDKEAEQLWEGKFVKKFSGIAKQALDRLVRLNAAKSLGDLGALRGNRLEALKGDRQGEYSIRVNDQYRICFGWEHPHSVEVELTDYHQHRRGTAGVPQPKDNEMATKKKKKGSILPSHPGLMLKEELDERGLSVHALAMALHVPATRMHAITHGKRSISADTSARLGRYFGMSADFWLNVQTQYDMRLVDACQVEQIIPAA